MTLFTSPGNIAFSIFGFDIYYYGILMGFVILVGIILSNKIANKFYKYDNNIILDVSPLIILSGILGARIYYCIVNFHYYFNHPLLILDFRSGGLSIHGSIIGGALALWYLSKRYNILFADLCDIFSVSLPLSQAIARWGNFFNSEAFGRVTNLPWKLYIAPEYRPDKYVDFSYFHPTFLYESILDLGIFFVMLRLFFNKDKSYSGKMTAIYLILYSVARIVVEYFRIDCTHFVFGVPLPIVVSFIIIVGALFFLFEKRNKFTS